jgi:hypothetical protein
LEVNKFKMDGQDIVEGKGMTKYLSIRSDNKKPKIKINEMMVLAIDSITGLVEVISNLMFPNGLNSSEVLSTSESSENKEK